ncbi:MAG: short-chain fatty acyl-CoA regulator family protein, partial [Pseudomonadota bacterium]
TDLAQQTGAPLPLVFRRFASLGADQMPGGESYGLVSCDASGTLTFRKPLPGFDLPRYSAACPFWPLFAALQRPMTPLASTLIMSGRDETRFRVQAFAELHYPAGFDGPGITEAWMLIEPQVLGEGAATRVGTSCRICPEEGCVARREPSVFS